MTARASLRDRIAKARDERFLDLAVPGLEPAVFVRYRALPPGRVEQIGKRVEKLRSDKLLQGALDVLGHACLGVFELDDDGAGVSPVEGFDGRVDPDTRALAGKLPTFGDPELGEALGADGQTAASTILALYVEPGDVVVASQAVLEHSGREGDELSKAAQAF